MERPELYITPLIINYPDNYIEVRALALWEKARNMVKPYETYKATQIESFLRAGIIDSADFIDICGKGMENMYHSLIAVPIDDSSTFSDIDNFITKAFLVACSELYKKYYVKLDSVFTYNFDNQIGNISEVDSDGIEHKRGKSIEADFIDWDEQLELAHTRTQKQINAVFKRWKDGELKGNSWQESGFSNHEDELRFKQQNWKVKIQSEEESRVREKARQYNVDTDLYKSIVAIVREEMQGAD